MVHCIDCIHTKVCKYNAFTHPSQIMNSDCCNFKPTCDVVPRSEVVRLEAQIRRLKAYDEERDIALHQRLVREAKQEIAREIIDKLRVKIAEDDNIFEKCASRLVGSDYCNGRSEAIGFVLGFIAEIEKKHIGE